ncbi:MAG: diacylglycerol kinase family protein [Phormidesmis sp.]
MFSRDSQFPRDSKTTREHPYEQGHRDSVKDIDLVRHNKSDSGADSSLPIAERSQSWQIAPNLFTSFQYAWAGIAYAFTTQRNFRIHTTVGCIAITLCWLLKVSTVEAAIICLTIGAVLVMEILNTALESLVDLTVGQTYHELAKIAKDCAAGAVLMAAIVALTIALLIFVPPLWDNLRNYIV